MRKRVELEITRETGKCESKGRKKTIKMRRNDYVITMLVTAMTIGTHKTT
jgi:hypothetical protein